MIPVIISGQDNSYHLLAEPKTLFTASSAVTLSCLIPETLYQPIAVKLRRYIIVSFSLKKELKFDVAQSKLKALPQY